MHFLPSRYAASWRRRFASVAAITLLTATATPVVQAQQSVARQWNEALIEAIRHDLARPTVHARNLYHISSAMWDAWATYDAKATGILFHEKHATNDPAIDDFRSESIAFATYRIMLHRFATSPGKVLTFAAIDQLMIDQGYDKDNTSTVGDGPAEIGNRIAATVIAYGLTDGSNEQNGYANQVYQVSNEPLIVALEGFPQMAFPDEWAGIAIEFFIDQGGNPIPGGYPAALSPEWGGVKNFAMSLADLSIFQKPGIDYDWQIFHDPGQKPLIDGTDGGEWYKTTHAFVSIWSSHLDPADGVMMDASPGGVGKAIVPVDAGVLNTAKFYDLFEGGDNGRGYDLNPVTGQPYAPQMVPRGDYARVLAEFWADGPTSETPPGHWYSIANKVSDDPNLVKRIGGTGPVLNDLEWDVKVYSALGGALHNCAVTIWGNKGYYDSARPVHSIRYMSDHGQSSDPFGPSYDPHGLPLYDDFVEVITAADTGPGGKFEHLAGEEGKIAIYAWRGPPFIVDPLVDVAGVGWILAGNWWPYQRPTFVTPPFPGYTSGHSGYSRAGAVIMDSLTGSPYFPGGLGEFECVQNEYLVFEEGPSVTVKLQWASYYDASDQCSLSRIWGGIHPPADDIPSRHIGEAIGHDAFARAQQYWNGTWADLDGGLGGVKGVPHLEGIGSLEAHSDNELQLLSANPSSLAVLFVSFSSTPAPFKGGTLIAAPVDLAVYLSTDAKGNLHLPFTFPEGVAAGTELYFQYGVQDAVGPKGVALSNAVKGTTP